MKGRKTNKKVLTEVAQHATPTFAAYAFVWLAAVAMKAVGIGHTSPTIFTRPARAALALVRPDACPIVGATVGA